MSLQSATMPFPAQLKTRLQVDPMLMAIGYLGPLFLIAASFSPPMPVIYAAWFCLGLADAWAVISFQAYLAEAVAAIEAFTRGR